MFTKSQALAIFSTMEQSKLIEALEAVGVPCDYGKEYLSAENGVDLSSWNARKVPLGHGHSGPLVDRSKLHVTMPATERRQNAEPDYKTKYMPEGSEDYAASAGPGMMY
jgi:hypothetical protein